MPSRPRSREQRYERCLKTVHAALCQQAEDLESIGATPYSNDTLALMNRLCARITRTLTPRPITSKQIHRLLSKP